MKKEFVTYKQAVALKELRFHTSAHELGYVVFGYFYSKNGDVVLSKHLGDFEEGEDLPAPLKQQVFRWFLEERELCIYVYPNSVSNKWYYDIQSAWGKYGFEEVGTSGGYFTREEAENAVIDKLIELAKEQDK